MSSQKFLSPLSPNHSSFILNTFNTEDLSKWYKKQLDFDLSKHLARLSDENQIHLLRCSKTGYEYFYPTGFQGDAIFYDSITNNPNYYSARRWEWDFVVSLINKTDKVLDVGAGNLQFLRIAGGAGISVEGLEVNPKSILFGKNEGLNVHQSDVTSFSSHTDEKYDLITSFHVLEHISDVSSFMSSCIRLLKPNGKLILAVPNNDSFIKIDTTLALNLPPHHMGRWTPTSIREMASLFNLEVIDLVVEPYSDSMVDWNYQCIYRSYASKYGIFGKMIGKLFESFIKSNLKRSASKISGPSLLVVLKVKI